MSWPKGKTWTQEEIERQRQARIGKGSRPDRKPRHEHACYFHGVYVCTAELCAMGWKNSIDCPSCLSEAAARAVRPGRPRGVVERHAP